jgi:flagellar M-ring protein FliF
MKERFTQLLDQFLAATASTKITLVLSMTMILAVVGVSGWYANRPDFVEHFSGLSAAQSASYKTALAEAGIPFKSSPPPAPYSIWVDSSDAIAAEAQVARGGYQLENKGIQTTSGGAQSAFLSAGERELMMSKREWQECEKLLESLDSVERATVVGSKRQRSPFRRDTPPTISVTLGLRYGTTLNSSEARNVATLVRSRFNVPIENITILDESGVLLHDGDSMTNGPNTGDLFEQKRRFENEAERKANQQLRLALGPGLASVTVSSDWIFDETESIKEGALSGQPTYNSKTTEETKLPNGAGVGGAAGVSSNVTQDFGVKNAGVGAGANSSPTAKKSSSTVTRSEVGRETEHRISRAPKIQRLSVALVVDQSVPADKLEDLNKMVKAAVGFVSDRDVYHSLQIALASVERDTEGNPVPLVVPEPVAAPNEYVELLLTHGVELFAGLAFVFVLLKTLRSTSNKQDGGAAQEGNLGGFGPDGESEHLSETELELLARVQIEELVRTKPERVSEILAQWAAEETATTGANK